MDLAGDQPPPNPAPPPPKREANVGEYELPELVREEMFTIWVHSHLSERALYIYLVGEGPFVHPNLRHEFI